VRLFGERDRLRTGEKTAAAALVRPKIGMTPLYESTELSSMYKTHVNVKDENGNRISNTAKDRRNLALIDTYRDMESTVFVQITAGNSGMSMAKLITQFLAEQENLGKIRKVVNIVSKNMPSKIKKALCGADSEIVEMDLDDHLITIPEMMEIARNAVKRKWGLGIQDHDVIPVEQHGIRGGYDEIAKEIYDAFINGTRPARIFVPAGSGHTLLDIAEKLKELWGKDCPLIVGVTTPDNPLVSEEFFVEQKESEREAEKLCTPYSPFKKAIAKLVKNGTILIKTVSNDEIRKTREELSRFGIQVEGASAAAFCGLDLYQNELKPDEINVVVNTGKGIGDDSFNGRASKRLKRISKRLSWISAIIAPVLLIGGALLVQPQQRPEEAESERFLQLQRREIEEQREYQAIAVLLSNLRFLLNSNGGRWIDQEELEMACRVLPDMDLRDCQEHEGRERRISQEHDFTEEEARFLISYFSSDDGNIGALIKSDLTRNYLKQRQTSRERIPSLFDRHYKIWARRQTKQNVDWHPELQCRFRDFDINHPFDPEREEACDW